MDTKTFRQEWTSWRAMHQRCADPNRKDYGRYGGLGVKVCEQWKSFGAFMTDMGPKPGRLHQLDRFPNGAGNYEPGNVRWATPFEQARNRKSTRFVTFADTTLCVKDWSLRAGLSTSVIRYRLDVGWPIERALTAPPHAGRRA